MPLSQAKLVPELNHISDVDRERLVLSNIPRETVRSHLDVKIRVEASASAGASTKTLNVKI